MDGQTLDAAEAVTLVDDGGTHRLRVVLGRQNSEDTVASSPLRRPKGVPLRVEEE
jgi:hypothetical protein